MRSGIRTKMCGFILEDDLEQEPIICSSCGSVSTDYNRVDLCIECENENICPNCGKFMTWEEHDREPGASDLSGYSCEHCGYGEEE